MIMMRRSLYLILGIVTDFVLCLIFILCALGHAPAFAFEIGKTYDSSNINEIEELLIPPIRNWVKNDELKIKTAKLEDELKRIDSFLEASRKNEGKFDIDEDGWIVNKSTGELRQFVYGWPFPTLDTNDPKFAQKLMENQVQMRSPLNAYKADTVVTLLGEDGAERSQTQQSWNLLYLNRPAGPLPNPKGYSGQYFGVTAQPMSMRGTAGMYFGYLDERLMTIYMYLPMLRRIRRGTEGERSASAVGGDMCSDDSNGWGGRNELMNWKYIEEKTILVPKHKHALKTGIMKTLPDGTIVRQPRPRTRFGYEVPGNKGPAWEMMDVVWIARPVYVLEITPKDPYYNFGKMLLFVDKDVYSIYFKMIYDRSGQYWKTSVVLDTHEVTDDGKLDAMFVDIYFMVDEKARHATFADALPSEETGRWGWELNLREDVLNSSMFTKTRLIQMSK